MAAHLPRGETDPEIGIDRNEALRAADRLYPCVQALFDMRHSVDVVLRAVGHAFFAQLKIAGADEAHLLKIETRFVRYCGTSPEWLDAVQRAYEPVQHEVAKLHGEGFDPVAIAWAFTGIIGQIVRLTLGKGAQKKIGNDLIRHIKMVRPPTNRAA